MGNAISTADAIANDRGAPTVVGNPDNWQLLTKFVSSDKEIVKSTKAVDLGHGCLVQVTTKEGSSVWIENWSCVGLMVGDSSAIAVTGLCKLEGSVLPVNWLTLESTHSET